MVFKNKLTTIGVKREPAQLGVLLQAVCNDHIWSIAVNIIVFGTLFFTITQLL